MNGQPTSHPAQAPASLVVAITARALFHLEDGHRVFEAQGIAAERVAHRLPANPHNAHYLDVKRAKSGHLD